MFSFFTNAIASEPQDQANKSKMPQAENQPQEQMMDSFESGSDQKVKKKHLLKDPNQISSQDFQKSSGGFEEFDSENDHFKELQPNQLPQKLQHAKSQNKAWKEVQINLSDTMNLDEDLNQSIRQQTYSFGPSKIKKFQNVKKSSFSQDDIEETQKQLPKKQEKEAKNEHQIFQKVQQPLQQHEAKPNFSKIKSKQAKMANVDTLFDYFGIGQSSPGKKSDQQKSQNQHFEDKTNYFNTENSFQIEQNSINESENKKSRISEKRGFVQNSFQIDEEDQRINLEISLISDKVVNNLPQIIAGKITNIVENKNPTLKAQNKKKSQKQQFSNKKKQKQINTTEIMQQSVYFQHVAQQPKTFSASKQKPQKKVKQPPFTIYIKDSFYFIKYHSYPDRLISQKLFQMITEHFLIKNIMLPMFNIKIFEDFQNQIQIQKRKERQQLFSIYANIYFEFLDKRHTEECDSFFKSKNERTTKSIIQSETKKEQTGTINTVYKKFIDYFKLNHYSKAEILKSSLESQLVFFQEHRQSINSYDQESPKLKQQQDRQNSQLDTKLKFLLKEISQLQTLISFEKSEVYCDKKLEEKLEENIWKERKRKLIEDRNWFITNLFPSCSV